MENPNATANRRRGSLIMAMENPFTLKVGQVFTGFGVGCGVGIGVGRPIYLGAIPVLQQVMTAARGATDVFSGVSRHANSSLKKYGLRNVEVGIGCGVGIGHGFGVGIALKPGVVQQVQSSVVQAVTKVITRFGISPSIPSVQNITPGSLHSSNLLSESADRSAYTSISGGLGFAAKTKGDAPLQLGSDDISHQDSFMSKGTPSQIELRSRSEKVINKFLQNPVLNDKEEMEVNELAGNLHSQNYVLQVLLQHQQAIQQLIEENRMLREVLMEDLQVPSSKLLTSRETKIASNNPCNDCFECRRRRRRSAR